MTDKPAKKEVMSIRLYPALRNALIQKAKERKVPINEIVEIALINYLANP